MNPHLQVKKVLVVLKNYCCTFWRQLKNHEEQEALIGSLESSANRIDLIEMWLNARDEMNCYTIKVFEPLISKRRIATVGGGAFNQDDKKVKSSKKEMQTCGIYKSTS